MAVAEIFLTPFITVLFEKLASADLVSLSRSARIHSQLTKWKITLSQIQTVLADAAQKQVKERAVQLWLHDLQDLAYDIDDLLDDLATEATRRKLGRDSRVPTCYSDFTLRNVMYGRKMSCKLDEITARLQNLAERKNILRLDDNVERLTRRNRRCEETSLVDESRIVGREQDKEALLRMLLGNDAFDENPGVVSVVGLGGIGKTTLAQVLYNERRVKDHFELMAWVCVSDEFDVFSISKAINQSVGGINQDFANLNLLHEALKEKLTRKRFLVVLDDVWNENYKDWELLRRPFVVGARGSRIIVTTRKTSVSSLVTNRVHAYNLDLLANKEAVSLFSQHALGEQNFDKHPTLKLYGEGIIKKCGGLPLALITLGRVLRTKSNDEEWGEVLNSEIWDLQNGNDILPALRLSYYDLPPHLKQMFAYCSLFTKDYVFDKDELVLLWMAEGFLYQSTGNGSMERLGGDYFDQLKSRSFFQYSSNDNSRYIMHDLINDLAVSVADDFFLRVDDKSKTELYDRNEAIDKCRYASYNHKGFGVYKRVMEFQRARRMRTLLTMHIRAKNYAYLFLSNKVLVDLLPHLPFLRVLSVTDCSISEIPQSIGNLKHMRYLNFSRSDIRCLPEQVGELYNLQSLLICGCCRLSTLPNSFRKLINLRHLDMIGTPLLQNIPKGIGGLTSLQTLSKVIIGGSDGFKISELKGLLHLRGRLSITGLHNLTNAIDAREANLGQKTGLDDLEMEWNDVFDDSQNGLTEYEVLEGLRPHNKLKNLKISFYKGTRFPVWVGDPTFDRLAQLTLRGCGRCTYLPTLGHLRSLRKLVIGSMHAVKSLGWELHRPSNSRSGTSFPSLEVLEFADMQGWESWSTDCGDNNDPTASFPRLNEISISNCPKLTLVSIGLIPSLRVLNIQGCWEEVFCSMVSVSYSIRKLTMCYIKGLTRLHGEILNHLVETEYLCVRWCADLRYLWESEPRACNILTRLQILKIESCENLVSLGKKDVTSGISVKSIREVHLRNCHRLETYNFPESIEKLVIFECPSISSLTFPTTNDPRPTLKILDIWGCDNLEESWLQRSFFSSLGSLFMSRLPNLRFLPEGCLVHLTYLTIWNCDNIESILDDDFGSLPVHCLKSLWISDCKNLKSFPYDHLRSVTSLQVLTLRNCPLLDDTFPCGLWPPHLSALRIGGLKKPISNWGTENFPTSLVRLDLHGENSGVVSFAKSNVRNNSKSTSSSLLLPASLTFLHLHSFMELESVSEGLQHLTGLEELHIGSCPKLRDLPETLLPLLTCLSIHSCRKLKHKCCSKKGKYWNAISQIPSVDV